MMKTIACIMLCSLAASAGAFDLTGGRSDGMAGTVLLSNPSAVDLTKCPAIGLTDGSFRIEAGWNRKYDLADLDRIYLMGGYGYRGLTAVIGLSQMGHSGYYTEQFFRGAVIYAYKRYHFGLVGSGRRLEYGRDLGKYTALAMGLTAGGYYRRFHLGLVADNLNRPKLAENIDGENARYKFYGEIDGGPRHSITLSLVLENYEKPLVSFGQLIKLNEYGSVFWGVSHNPVTYGGGLSAVYRSININYAAVYHPELGLNHTVSVEYGLRTTPSRDR